MSGPQTIRIPYTPREPFRPFHARRQRYACLVCHRRSGKTVAAINDLIRAAVTFQTPNPAAPGRFAYIAPQFSQAKDIAWSYLKLYTADIPGVKEHESELRINFAHNGAMIRLYGAENEQRLRGTYLDGAILDEYANMAPGVYDKVIRPMLSDRKGWAVFMGTPAGHNLFHEKWTTALAHPDDYFTLRLKATESGILDPDELVALQRDMTESGFAQEYECDFEAAILGAVYGAELKKLDAREAFTSVPYDPSAEVWTSWDLGIGKGGALSIWFAQQVGREVRVIDFYDAFGAGLDHFVKVLRDKPYIYGTHILPHDAGKSEVTSGANAEETLRSLGLRPTKVLRRSSLEDGINKTRLFLPRCVFDQKACEKGIEALRLYRYDYEEATGFTSRRPKHDWTSNPADSFRYMALGFNPDNSRHTPLVYPNLAIP